MRYITAFVAAGLFVFPHGAAAQASASAVRGFISINGGLQATANDFRDDAVFVANAEQARFTTDYAVEEGPTFNIGGGAVLWKQLGIGVGLTRFSRSTPTTVDASIPHPFFFNRDRAVNGEVGGLKRQETAAHVRATGVLPMGYGLHVVVFGGPSFFQIEQGIVTDFRYRDEYPFDSAAFEQGITTTAKESTVGFNAGADVAFFFTRHVGVGGLLQYAGATVTLPTAAGGTQDVKVGGVQAGGGLRLRF